MKIKYLGTGASEGWPGVFCQCGPCGEARRLGGKNIRRRSCALIDGTLLLDFPPDVYSQSLCLGVELPSIKHIAVTHNHTDHLYTREIRYLAEPFAHVTDGVPVCFYGSSTVVEGINASLDREFGGRLEVAEVFPFTPFSAAGCTITPLPAQHNAGVCFLYLVESGGRALLYAHDTGLLPEESMEYLKGRRLDLVSMDCTMITEDCYLYHMSVSGNVQTKRRLMEQGSAHAGTVFVSNHFSHNGRLLHHEIERVLAPHGIIPSYDGMEIEF